MIRHKALFLWMAGLLFLLPFGTGAWGEEKPLSVTVAIPPLQFLAEQIGGDAVTVHALLPPGRDPHTYTPLPGQLRDLAQSSCFFYLGLPLEKDLLRAGGTGEHLRIVPLLSGITLRQMEHDHHHHHDHAEDHGDNHAHEDHEDHAHDHEHQKEEILPEAEGTAHEQEHQHHEGHAHHDENDLPSLEGYDPHVWLSPQNMAIMAHTMGKAFQEMDPLRKEAYAANTEVLVDQLEVLHGYLQSVLKPVQGRTLLVFHPAYGYFCHAYGLQQMAVEREGKAPKGKELSELIQTAQKEQIRAIFTQPQFDKRTAETVASAIGARVISFDPFPKDYVTYFQTMGAILRRELQAEPENNAATE